MYWSNFINDRTFDNGITNPTSYHSSAVVKQLARGKKAGVKKEDKVPVVAQYKFFGIWPSQVSSIAVDYGSTDNTISIIRDSYLKEDRVDFYDKSELKYHEAMKFGVSKCSAPLIAVVHPEVSLSDDMINGSLSEMMDKKDLGP